MHPVQFRTIEIDLARAGDDDVIPAVLSSETPVDRGDYVEVLEHTPESIDLSRAPIPLIEGHDASRTNIGIVEDLVIDGGKLRGRVRFGKSARAREVLADVRAGIVRSLSIGYRIKKWRNEGRRMIATLTEVLEVSVVPVPADPQAGFFRSLPMTDSTIALTGDAAAAARAERERCAAITDLATRHNKRALGDQAIAEGTPLDQFRGLILDQVGQPALSLPSTDLGMSKREQRSYSLMRVVRALSDPHKYSADAGLEREVSRAMARADGKEPRGFMVPLDLLAKRDLSTSVAGGTPQAGNLVATDLLAEQFVDVLRNASVTIQAGARVLSGLVGNVAIPRRTAGVTAAWVGEGSAASEGTNSFDQITMSPKTVSAWLDVTRRLMLQSTPMADQLVRDDLMQTLMLAVDDAALGAGGANKPTGIRGTSGIGSVAIGTNGGAATWSAIVNLAREVAIDNALSGSPIYVTNEKVRAALAQTLHTSSTGANFLLPAPYNSLYGYRFATSNAIPSDLDKGSSTGVCSAMIFGNFADLIIGTWSGVDLIVDPYTESTKGTTRIVAFQDVDCAVRHVESFSVCADITT